MPLFEFTCRKCGEKFEELLSHAELAAAGPRCPACGSRRVERGISSFSTATGGGAASEGCPMGRNAPAGGCGGGGGFT